MKEIVRDITPGGDTGGFGDGGTVFIDGTGI